MRYDLAWPEVWDALKPVVASAMAGNVIHVEEAQMFLKRGNFLEGPSEAASSNSTSLTDIPSARNVLHLVNDSSPRPKWCSRRNFYSKLRQHGTCDIRAKDPHSQHLESSYHRGEVH